MDSPRAPQRLTVEAPVTWVTPTQIWVRLPVSQVALNGEPVTLPATKRRLERMQPRLSWDSQRMEPGAALDWLDKPFYPKVGGRWAAAKKATYYTRAAWEAYQELLADSRPPAQSTSGAPDRPSPHALLLGLGAQASPEEVVAAFRAKAMSAHPDKGGDPEEFRRLIVARDTLLENI